MDSKLTGERDDLPPSVLTFLRGGDECEQLDIGWDSDLQSFEVFTFGNGNFAIYVRSLIDNDTGLITDELHDHFVVVTSRTARRIAAAIIRGLGR